TGHSLRGVVQRPHVWMLIELIVIAIWATIVGSAMLDFNEDVVPAAFDYTDNLQGLFVWEHARDCGFCALWNGDINGGAPAFVDTMSPVLHPLAIATTLAWGAIDASKIIIVSSLALGGFGQLWLGYGLGIGRIARLFAACIAVGAGHLVGPLEGGLFALTLSAASASFVIAGVVHLYNNPTLRSLAILSICTALLLVSGQGYIQTAVVLLAPLSAILLLTQSQINWRTVYRRGAAFILMTALIAAPLIVPYLHAFRYIGKEIDPDFRAAQPFRFIPLNLVVDDWNLFHSQMLGLEPYPSWYLNYVGWIPIVFAAVGVVALWRKNWQMTAFLLLLTIGTFVLASAVPLRALLHLFSPSSIIGEFLVGLRNIHLVARLAIIPLLGLSAVGFDTLWGWKQGHESRSVTVEVSGRSRNMKYRPDLRPIVVVLAIIALLDIRGFSQTWISPVEIRRSDTALVLTQLETDDMQWVQTPFGERWYAMHTPDHDLKIANMWRPWHLSDREFPPPYLEATSGGDVPYPSEELSSTAPNGRLFRATESPSYVTLNGNGGESRCSATGSGGSIDIVCTSGTATSIQVLENYLPGWQANVNGEDTQVTRMIQWLAVDIPAGTSMIELRYRPWDIWLGVIGFIVGIAWAFYWIMLRESDRQNRADTERSTATRSPVDFVPYPAADDL
ncbi:MAG: hypothetical protein AB7V46_09600, partial [Thermomicrobiales bacterium]